MRSYQYLRIASQRWPALSTSKVVLQIQYKQNAQNLSISVNAAAQSTNVWHFTCLATTFPCLIPVPLLTYTHCSLHEPLHPTRDLTMATSAAPLFSPATTTLHRPSGADDRPTTNNHRPQSIVLSRPTNSDFIFGPESLRAAQVKPALHVPCTGHILTFGNILR